jgi:hypothetical protein
MGLEVAESWSDGRRARAAAKLADIKKRQRIVQSYDHPAQLLQACMPAYTLTPAIELMSQQIEKALRGRRRRLMITAPPQEGKSLLCSVGTPLRALQLHPDWRVMLLTYADGLAEEHSRTARSLVQEYGSGVVDSLTGTQLPDLLGLSLHPDKATASNWRIQEGDGGLVAAGRDATITGKRADLLIVDDPFKNMQEADSAAIRQKVIDWYNSVATTRLSAGASVIFINTRWHPEDLSGHLLASDRGLPEELREWRYINIPAVSHPAIPDALGREPGVALISARGRTKEDFEAIERNVGKRVWNALYQGSPTPPEGGLFSGQWFDDHRMETMPERTRLRVVAVDPSESGEGDEAGVVAAAALYPPEEALEKDPRTGVVYIARPYPQVVLTHDRSAQMTSDQWAKAAVQLALETEASEIYVETYTAGTTYINVVKAEILAREKAAMAAGDMKTAQWLKWLHHRVKGWRGTGDSVARSGLLRQAVEVGTCVVLGHEMAEMETQAKLWQAGQHQPDRVAASVIAHERLMNSMGQAAAIGSPVSGTPGNSARNQWLSRKVG